MIVPNTNANFDVTANDGIGAGAVVCTFEDTTMNGMLYATKADGVVYQLYCSNGVLKAVRSMPKGNAYYLSGCLVGRGI